MTEEKIYEVKLLNRKRVKSRSMQRHKNKKKKHAKKKEKKGKLLQEVKIIRPKNNNLIKQNLRHFFHVNWEDNIYNKEIIKIEESLGPIVYWSLINTSYFIEENIQDNIQMLKEKCSKKIDLNINNGNDNEELSMNSLDIYNKNNDKENSISKDIMCVMDFINYDKKGKHFNNVFGYNEGKSYLNLFKNKLKNYITIFEHLNKEKIKDLQKYANMLEDEYNRKNPNGDSENNSNDKINYNENDEIVEWPKENSLYTKNSLSHSIYNKYIEYLYDKEKKNLLKEELNDKKETEDEYPEYINRCNICNNGDLNNYAFYLECFVCGTRVHPYCYGVRAKNEPKKWKCEKCREMTFKESSNCECLLCPNKGGAMKKLNLPKNTEVYNNLMNFRKNEKELPEKNNIILIPETNFKKIDCAWVHLTCALWNPEVVKFGNIELKTNIFLDEQNIYTKYNSPCNICKKDNYGPTAKCKSENCNFRCHPECARINNYYLEVEMIDNNERNVNYNVYCHIHHPNKYAKIVNNRIRYEANVIYDFDDSLNRVYQLYKINYKKEFYYPIIDEKIDLIEIPIDLSEEESMIDESISSISEKENKENKLYDKVKKNGYKSNYKISFYQKNNDIFKIKKKKNDKNISLQNSFDGVNIYSNELIGDKYINLYENPKKVEDKEKGVYLINHLEEKNNIHTKNLFSERSLSQKSNYINLNNSINNEIDKPNGSYNKENIAPAPIITLDEEIEKNKESFITYLIGYINDFYKENRIIISKRNGCYEIEKEEEEGDFLYDIQYSDLFNETFYLSEIHYKDLTTNLIKKYLKHIFSNEDDFNKLFIDKIGPVLKMLKNNQKYKDRKIICRNREFCVGKKDGIYSLLNIDEFKYQIIDDNNIPQNFLCYKCLNNYDEDLKNL